MKDSVLGPGAVEWLGVQYKTLLSADQTGGVLSVVDILSPGLSGPPRHVHHDADETFVLMTGEVEFWVDGQTFTRGPGDTAFVPRGTPHTFRVLGTEPSRHLVILTPGGFEAFFVAMAEGGYRIPQDMGPINEIAARHHLTFTGPPLGA